jgi:hypothetical protein
MALYARLKQLGEIAHHREKLGFAVRTEPFDCEEPQCPYGGHVYFIFEPQGDLTIAFNDSHFYLAVVRIVTHLSEEELRQACNVKVH